MYAYFSVGAPYRFRFRFWGMTSLGNIGASRLSLLVEIHVVGFATRRLAAVQTVYGSQKAKNGIGEGKSRSMWRIATLRPPTISSRCLCYVIGAFEIRVCPHSMPLVGHTKVWAFFKDTNVRLRDKVSALVRLLFRRRSLPLQDSASKTQARCQPLHAYFSVSALYRFGSVGREPV